MSEIAQQLTRLGTPPAEREGADRSLNDVTCPDIFKISPELARELGLVRRMGGAVLIMVRDQEQPEA